MKKMVIYGGFMFPLPMQIAGIAGVPVILYFVYTESPFLLMGLVIPLLLAIGRHGFLLDMNKGMYKHFIDIAGIKFGSSHPAPDRFLCLTVARRKAYRKFLGQTKSSEEISIDLWASTDEKINVYQGPKKKAFKHLRQLHTMLGTGIYSGYFAPGRELDPKQLFSNQ